MTSAQEEFNELMRDKSHRAAHPADHSDDDDNDNRSFSSTSSASFRHNNAYPRTAHFDDDEDFDDDDDYDDDDFDLESAPRPSLSSARSTIPRARSHANTGPKGVIADAQHFRDSRRSHLRQESVLAAAQTAVAAAAVPSLLREKSGADERGEEEGEEGLEDEEDDDGEADDAFVDEWRRSRLRELQSGARERRDAAAAAAAATSAVTLPPRLQPGRRTFGGLPKVDGDGYLDAVDNSPPDTVVLVYIYDDFSDVSTALEDNCIRPLAALHPHARFVKMHYEDAEMEPAGVPALVAYRGGDKFAALVPLIDEIPDDADLSATTLERVLKRHQILK